MKTAHRVPDTMMCHKHGVRHTMRVWAIEPHLRSPGDAPIVPELTLLRVTLSCGCTRSFGVERAWINSRLQMCCEGGFINPQNELAKTFPLTDEV